MRQYRFGSTIGVLIAGALALSGCAAESDEPQNDVTMSEESSATEEREVGEGVAAEADDASSSENSGGTVQIPDDFWPGAPIPDYEIFDVYEHDERDYLLYMRGTDIEGDARAIESLLVDEGFHRLAWGITEERGANGIFLTEDTRVTLTIQETDGEVEIRYGVGPYDPNE